MSGVAGMRWGRDLPDDVLEPCGTLAAYRRHLRRGDPVDRDCAQANARAWRGRAAAGYRRPSRAGRRQVHLAGAGAKSLCGRRPRSAMTGDPGEATCGHCAAVLRRHLADAQARGRSRAA